MTTTLKKPRTAKRTAASAKPANAVIQVRTSAMVCYMEMIGKDSPAFSQKKG